MPVWNNFGFAFIGFCEYDITSIKILRKQKCEKALISNETGYRDAIKTEKKQGNMRTGIRENSALYSA